jgi:hypothetical protein
MADFLWGIGGGIIGVVVGMLTQEVFLYFRSRRGILTGTWSQIIDAQKGELFKRDLVKCLHFGSDIKGTIKRIEPECQNYKRWKFRGKRIGNLVFVTFWTDDQINNPLSYGTIQLNVIDENDLRGFYARLVVTLGQKQFSGELEDFVLQWKRLPKPRL